MKYWFKMTGKLFAVLVILSTGTPVFAANHAPSATLTVSFDNAGFLLGFHTGKGILTLKDGSEFAFRIDGYSLGGFGFADATGSGKVYNLQKASDISGEYSGTGSGTAFGEGDGDAQLKNDSNQVKIDLKSKLSGIRLGLGVGAVTFRLGKMLKEPRPQPVAKAPPPVQVVKKTAPAVIPKPTRYVLEFGFNKSRVNLATGRILDSILADWKNKPVMFRIIGHADMVGGEKFNQKLSEKRAEAVKSALVKRGVPGSKIIARGVGQAELAVPTKRGARLRANRRVVLTIERSR